MASYDRLSALDSSFLALEDDNTHMHVGVAMIFEPGLLATRELGLDMERVRAYIESRLHLIPRYRQRLAYVPIERHPVWVDDPRFNIFYHVRHTCLPKPGSVRQLKRLCGRILSQKLDRTKPLWEIWVIEGVEGNRIATVAKAHHCLIDGASGTDLLTALLSSTEETSFEPAIPWVPRRAPDAVGLLSGEFQRYVHGVGSLISGATHALTHPGKLLQETKDTAVGLVDALSAAFTPASDTPLNSPIGPHRRFDWLQFDLDTVRDVKNHCDATINDVVLATVAGAVRRFLQLRGMTRLDDVDFRALIPVNIRRTGDVSLGNRVSQMLAHLPVEEHDPMRRLRRVCETVRNLKRSHQIEATEFVEELSDWTATSLLSGASRLAVDRRAFNMIVTNVPGPKTPLYMLGAPLREVYPMVPLFANQTLGVALFSYAGRLFWGINADWDEVPDLHAFVEALQASFDELRAASSTEPLATARAHA